MIHFSSHQTSPWTGCQEFCLGLRKGDEERSTGDTRGKKRPNGNHKGWANRARIKITNCPILIPRHSRAKRVQRVPKSRMISHANVLDETDIFQCALAISLRIVFGRRSKFGDVGLQAKSGWAICSFCQQSKSFRKQESWYTKLPNVAPCFYFRFYYRYYYSFSFILSYKTCVEHIFGANISHFDGTMKRNPGCYKIRRARGRCVAF